MHDPDAFAAAWIDAWNAHDLDRILAHYAEDIVFLSPVAARVTGSARVEGKAALGAYWGTAFARASDLKFALERVYAGDGALTIAYRNQTGRFVAETFAFGADGKVVFAAACYAS